MQNTQVIVRQSSAQIQPTQIELFFHHDFFLSSGKSPLVSASNNLSSLNTCQCVCVYVRMCICVYVCMCVCPHCFVEFTYMLGLPTKPKMESFILKADERTERLCGCTPQLDSIAWLKPQKTFAKNKQKWTCSVIGVIVMWVSNMRYATHLCHEKGSV